MGEAKQRGTFEERRAAAIAAGRFKYRLEKDRIYASTPGISRATAAIVARNMTTRDVELPESSGLRRAFDVIGAIKDLFR